MGPDQDPRASCPAPGFTVLFTGLSGAGKSTLARGLLARLRERGLHRLTLLDGDVVREHLSSELGFTKADRDLNIQRIAFVAREITRHGGVTLCAPIAPYADARRRMRATIETVGGFVEVHVATPLAVCEARDPKGMYAKARAGLVQAFTGVSDPYEEPERAELRIETQDVTPEAAVERILAELERRGYLARSMDERRRIAPS